MMALVFYLAGIPITWYILHRLIVADMVKGCDFDEERSSPGHIFFQGFFWPILAFFFLIFWCNDSEKNGYKNLVKRHAKKQAAKDSNNTLIP